LQPDVLDFMQALPDFLSIKIPRKSFPPRKKDKKYFE